MAGTVTITEIRDRSIQKIIFEWITDSGGLADAITENLYTGRVIRAVQIPDGGASAPTTLYDVSILDGDGADILQGTGANLNSSVITEANDLGCISESLLSLSVENAGDSNGGKTIVYVERI